MGTGTESRIAEGWPIRGQRFLRKGPAGYRVVPFSPK